MYTVMVYFTQHQYKSDRKLYVGLIFKDVDFCLMCDIYFVDFHVYNYFIKIVPTEVRTYAAGNIDTFQFSVTQRVRRVKNLILVQWFCNQYFDWLIH